MKVCYNCHSDVRDSDIYCRTCGSYLTKNSYHVLINIGIVLISIAIIGLIILFIASYLVNK